MAYLLKISLRLIQTGFSVFFIFFTQKLFKFTVDIRNPNARILAFWKIVWLLNRSNFERRLKSKRYSSVIGRSVAIFNAIYITERLDFRRLL